MIDIHRRDTLRLLAAAMAGLGVGGSALSATDAAPPGAAAIRERAIPSTGELLPVIGLGTWQTFDAGPSRQERAPLEEVLQTFVALGGRLIDSSPMYGRSEEAVGDITAKLGLNESLFMATKVWTQGEKAGIRQMEESMKKLRARPIDLMQVHNLVDVNTHLATLRDWKQAGIVRYIGITHYTAHGAEALAKTIASQPVDFIQINYSVGEREAEKRLFPLAKERGVAVIANRPFAGGDMFRRLRDRPLPDWASHIDCTSWAQLLLKFVVSHPAVTCAIPATAKPSHVRDNMKAGFGALPDEKMRAKIVAEATQI